LLLQSNELICDALGFCLNCCSVPFGAKGQQAKQKKLTKSILFFLFFKVWWHDANFFVYFLYFKLHIHLLNHIHTIHFSVAIRQGLSPYLHRWSAQWENLPVVPSRESNSGLPNSMPALYQLSNAAP
jgi:hypothetical protein